MHDELVNCRRLLGSKHPAEAEVDLLRVDAIVGDLQPASQTGEKVDDPLGEASRKVEPLEVLPIAADEPGCVPGREPHPLLLKELGVGDRPKVLECRHHRGRHTGPVDRECGPESDPDHRRRGWSAATGQLGEAERRPGIHGTQGCCELRHRIS